MPQHYYTIITSPKDTFNASLQIQMQQGIRTRVIQKKFSFMNLGVWSLYQLQLCGKFFWFYPQMKRKIFAEKLLLLESFWEALSPCVMTPGTFMATLSTASQAATLSLLHNILQVPIQLYSHILHMEQGWVRVLKTLKNCFLFANSLTEVHWIYLHI